MSTDGTSQDSIRPHHVMRRIRSGGWRADVSGVAVRLACGPLA
jgi:hypothetical protein